MTITITIPGLRTLSEPNRRDHWAARKKRFDSQRLHVRIFCPPSLRLFGLKGSLRVEFIRFGPRALDSDNLAASFKAIRDETASLLHRDDGDPLIEWTYSQRHGPYAVQILIDSLANCT